MILVTGSARTGTSLMMQTLIKMSYKSIAPKFLKEHDEIREYNSNGFYEIGLDSILSIDENDQGKVVKIFPSCFDVIDFDMIDKIIVMTRNREDAIKSSIPVLSKLGVPMDSISDVYDKSYERIKSINDEIPIIFINFEDILNVPESTILSIAAFLGKTLSSEQLIDSINNVKKK